MKIQSVADLAAEMQKVARGEIAAPADAASPSAESAALAADIDAGLVDVAAGRVKSFDADTIIERGRKLSASQIKK